MIKLFTVRMKYQEQYNSMIWYGMISFHLLYTDSGRGDDRHDCTLLFNQAVEENGNYVKGLI